MRFIADEGIDKQIVVVLRENGHDVLYVAEYDSGVTDSQVLAKANDDNRILLTRDKDFGEMVYRHRSVHTGIILNRLHQLDAASKAKLVLEVINQHSDELLGSYTVIQPGRVRIRKMI